MRVIALSALYRDDRDDGFSFHILSPDLHESWERLHGETQARPTAKQLKIARRVLRHGRRGQTLPGMTEHETVAALTKSVYWLERHGFIKSDEYNGVVVGVLDRHGIPRVFHDLTEAHRWIALDEAAGQTRH
jgi:hypothetical protein